MQSARDFQRMIATRLQRFTERHPFIGPIFWLLAVQYFVVQVLVASAWPKAYDLKSNLISDLGAVATCGEFDGRFVCSPLADLMNLSFMVFGVTITAGAVLIYREFKRTKLSKTAFVLMAISGLGTVMVGAFPEDTMPVLHQIGAVLALLLGNVAIVLLAASLRGIRAAFRIYTYASGGLSIIAFVLFISGIHFGLGDGGMERVISYPFTVWMMLFGAYMTIVRLKMHFLAAN